MEIEDVVDQGSLEAYLERLEPEVRISTAHRVAFRSAVRVAPVALLAFSMHESNPGLDWKRLSLFGAILISSSRTKIDNFDNEIAQTYADAHDEYISNNMSGSNVAKSAADALDNSVDAVVSTTVSEIISFASGAVKLVADVLAQDNLLWRLVRDDLAMEKTEIQSPLWINNDCPANLFQSWTATKAALSDEVGEIDWSFWVAWYQRILEGANTYPFVINSVLKDLSVNDWIEDHVAFNRKFSEVLAIYRFDEKIQKNAYGHNARINLKTDRLQLVPTSVVDLADVIMKARSFMRDFNRRCKNEGGHNQLGVVVQNVLKSEIIAFKRNLKKFQNDPQSLYNEIIRQTKHMRRLLERERYDDVPAAQSLLDDFETLPSEICLVSPSVRAAAAQRAELQIEQASDAELAMAALACHGLEGDGEGQMRFFAAYAKKVLLNPDADIDEKVIAWTFAKEITVRAAREVKLHNADETKKKTAIGQKLKNTSDMAVALDKLGDVGEEAYTEAWLGIDKLAKWVPDFLGGGTT